MQYNNKVKGKHRNKLFEVTCSNGTVLYESGTSEQDVKMFIHNCYPSYKVCHIEQIK